MDLPQPLQNEIVRLSRPGIDARRAMGIPPGELRVPADLRSTLENMRRPYGNMTVRLPRYTLWYLPEIYTVVHRHVISTYPYLRSWDMVTGREFDRNAGSQVLFTEEETLARHGL